MPWNNATTNLFFDTVYFNDGEDPKGKLLPGENGKADLGSSSLKFDNLYVNNIRGRSVVRGTWTPSLRWSRSPYRYVNPASLSIPLPRFNLIEALYTKKERRVSCSYLFSTTQPSYSSSGSWSLSSPLGGLPFRIYQRFPLLKNMVAASADTNYFNYNSTSFPNTVTVYKTIYRTNYDSNQKSVGDSPNSFRLISVSVSAENSGQTKYFYGSFEYETNE